MLRSLALLTGILSLAACAPMGASPTGPRATASLQSTAGNSAAGIVRFAQRGDKVLVSGTVSGLRPLALHGFHVHEKGDCSSPDATSAGGHFNPGGQPHGRHTAMAHHAGDLASLQADENGVARFAFEATGLSVGGGASDIVGRALIVHRDPDDYTTQPTGNSGPRLACAVIAAAP